MTDLYSDWRDFYADKVRSWMSLEELRAECGKLQTVDNPSPEVLLVHAMHALEELQAEVERLRTDGASAALGKGKQSMNRINDGGPAFPTYASDHRGAACNTTFEPKGGVTLRDYFAAKAMQSMLTGTKQFAGCELEEVPLAVIHDTIAAWSYLMADAMLKAREET